MELREDPSSGLESKAKLRALSITSVHHKHYVLLDLLCTGRLKYS